MRLAEAIERWRAERDVVLAEQIDVLSQAVAPLPLPPPKRVNRWWMDLAKTYDPEIVTTLLAHLRTHANDERLGDRIRTMLAWPDDPRVAVVLAETLARDPFAGLQRVMLRRHLANPFVDDIVKRIVEIGDARAIERAGSLWSLLGDETRSRIAAAHVREPRYARATVPIVETAWTAVVAEPFAVQPRLVLADAYLQIGDVRGEVIATQCAPLLAIEQARARGEKIDASGLFGVRAEQMHDLIDRNWHRWLGDVALLVGRSSKFRGGLLADVTIGNAATPAGSWIYERVAGHRELCAVEHVRPSSWIRPARHVELLAALAHVPRWIYVTDAIVAEMRTRPIRARSVSIAALHGQPSRRLAAIVDDVIEAAPSVERIAFDHIARSQLVEIREIAARVTVPLQFTVDWTPTAEQRAIIDELRALPRITIVSYGDP